MQNPARSAGNLLRALLGKLQRESYTKSGAERREILFEGPFGQNAKGILYKIRREAPEPGRRLGRRRKSWRPGRCARVPNTPLLDIKLTDRKWDIRHVSQIIPPPPGFY